MSVEPFSSNLKLKFIHFLKKTDSVKVFHFVYLSTLSADTGDQQKELFIVMLYVWCKLYITLYRLPCNIFMCTVYVRWTANIYLCGSYVFFVLLFAIYREGIRVLAHCGYCCQDSRKRSSCCCAAATGDSIQTELSKEADRFKISLISNHKIVTVRIKSYACCKMCSQALLTFADTKITCDDFSRNLDV